MFGIVNRLTHRVCAYKSSANLKAMNDIWYLVYVQISTIIRFHSSKTNKQTFPIAEIRSNTHTISEVEEIEKTTQHQQFVYIFNLIQKQNE